MRRHCVVYTISPENSLDPSGSRSKPSHSIITGLSVEYGFDDTMVILCHICFIGQRRCLCTYYTYFQFDYVSFRCHSHLQSTIFSYIESCQTNGNYRCPFIHSTHNICTCIAGLFCLPRIHFIYIYFLCI